MKYKLTDETIVFGLVTLRRIMGLRDIDGICKSQDLGGFIESEKNLSQDGDAWVFDDAQVFGDAWVFGDARVSGNALVSGDARVSCLCKKLIQIQGSRNFVTIQDNMIQIGCYLKTKEEWIEKHVNIGDKEGYSKDQIAEYLRYINLATDSENKE